MSLPAKDDIRQLLASLRKDFPGIAFESSQDFRWNADKKVVFFSTKSERPVWSLLHELGHMDLAHQKYDSDVCLIRMEAAAWQKAKQLGNQYGYIIDEDYIQDCMDSYRDWLHQRSTCPSCNQTGLEESAGTYKCLNCQSEWRVSQNRFCRVYRKTKSPG